MKQYSINVSKEAFLKFLVIENSRPQDMNRAQTFDYLLRVFEESPIRIDICKNLLSQRTGVETLSIITPSSLADKLRRDAIKATQDAPTKNNTYKETKE